MQNKRKYFYILSLLFFFLISNAQNFQRIDSLTKAINKVKDSVEKTKTYLRLGSEYTKSKDFKTAIKFYNLSTKLSKKINDSTLNYQSTLNLADAYKSQSAYSAALHWYLDAYEQLKNKPQNSIPMADILSNISIAYWRLEENTKALDFQKKALAIQTKLNNRLGMASCYNNLGIIYRSTGDHGNALESYFKSIEISKESVDVVTLMHTYNNVGLIYYVIQNHELALKYYSIALKMAEEEKDDLQTEIILGNLGALYATLNDNKNAELYLVRGLKIADALNDEEGKQEINYNLSDVYLKFGKIEKSFECYKNYIKSRDVLKNEEIEQETKRDEIKYEFEKEKIELKKEQEKRDAISLAEKKKQTIITYTVSVFLVIVILLSIFLYNRFKLAKSQKNTIEHQKKLVDEKQKEILDSINYAKRIQDSLLDNFDAVNKFFTDAFVLYKPKDIVSGDFYWLSKKIQNKNISATESTVEELFYIAICDSTGHGVPGGFMSLLNTAYLSEAINEKNIHEPNKIFDYVRTRLISTISKTSQKDGFDGVLLCFNKTFTFKNKELINSQFSLSYAAAHNAPVIINNNLLLDLQTNKMPVGFGEKSENFTLFTYPIQKNDVIFVFTDGYADQFGGPKGKKFKYKPLNDLLLSINQLPMNQQSEILNEKFETWKGNLEQVDDVLVVGIKI